MTLAEQLRMEDRLAGMMHPVLEPHWEQMMRPPWGLSSMRCRCQWVGSMGSFRGFMMFLGSTWVADREPKPIVCMFGDS